jgi:hypothetical protein
MAGDEATGVQPASTPADALASLLEPYADPALAGRLLDVPPDVAGRALELLPRKLAAARLNLVQPPMTWLVKQADDMHGRLVGSLTHGRPLAVFDGIQVAAAAARELARRVAADFPAVGDLPSALESATAETWTSWSAEWPTSSGSGTRLLTRPLPPGTAVVGLWWT